MAEITYICKRTVVSTKPVQPGKSHRLSVLDRLADPNRNVMMVYYYRSGATAGEITRKLRESLAEVLTYIPAVTGRLVQAEGDKGGCDKSDNWAVKCNDAGVRMVEARVKGSVEDWLRIVDCENEKRLIHWEEMYHKPYFWSTFYVQLTEFEEGGFAVGLSCTQLLSDPTCAAMLIKAWADVTLRGKMTRPPLFHQLPAHHPGNRSSDLNPFTELCGHPWTSSAQPGTSPIKVHNHNKLKTISLLFTDQMVTSCMTPFQAHADGPGPSPFAALAGLLWASVSRVKGLRNGLVSLTMGLDVRKVLGLNEGYFGNCLVYSHVDPSFEDNGPLGAAKAISEKMAKFDKGKVNDLVQWLHHNDESKATQEMLTSSDLLCVNLESMDPRWAVFKDGSHPIHTSIYLEPACDKGQFLILPAVHHGDGPMSRVVMVTLPEDEAGKFCRDGLIRRFAPTILMGARTYTV